VGGERGVISIESLEQELGGKTPELRDVLGNDGDARHDDVSELEVVEPDARTG